MTDEHQAQRELYLREYDPQKLIPGWQEEIAYLGVESEHARKAHPDRLDQRYGPDDLQRLDLFVPEGVKRPPIQMFFHGGGWQGGDKATRAYPAKWFGPKGVVWASVNYRLAPHATLDEIVDDARHALRWIYENAGIFGGDRNRIFVTGNSAGGHLTGCLLMPGWKGDYGLPEDVIKGATTLSGVFDMRPVERSGVRSTVPMDAEMAARQSPICHLGPGGPPLIISWGADETSVFKSQSRDYAAAWRAAGNIADELEVPECHHFTILDALNRPDDPLMQAIFRQMGVS